MRKKETFIEPQLKEDGYLYVTLEKDGMANEFPVHFLVAQAFVANPDNLPLVKHINGDKTDNRAENLEWCNSL